MTGTACTGAPIAAAARPGASNVGDATTSDRDDDVKAIVAARSSSPEPGVRYDPRRFDLVLRGERVDQRLTGTTGIAVGLARRGEKRVLRRGTEPARVLVAAEPQQGVRATDVGGPGHAIEPGAARRDTRGRDDARGGGGEHAAQQPATRELATRERRERRRDVDVVRVA